MTPQIMQNWVQLTAIQLGGMICLPAVMIGHFLVGHYGFEAAFIALFIGNGFLLLLGLRMVAIAVHHRKTTMKIAEQCFNGRFIAIPALATVISLGGWFAINLLLMGEESLQLFQQPKDKNSWPLFAIILALGCGITAITYYGIRALEFFANLSLPFLLAILAVAIWQSHDQPLLNLPPSKANIGGAIAIVITAGLAMVFDIPTYYRFARTVNQARISIILLFAFFVPLVEGIGVYIALHCEEGLLALLAQDGGPLWQLMILLFLILAGATTNVANLYSSSINSQSLLPALSFGQRTLLIGIVATLFASLPALRQIELLLEGMSLMIGAIGAVMIGHHWRKGSSKTINLWIVLLSTFQGISVMGGGTSLTGHGFMDSALLAFMLYALATLFRTTRRNDVLSDAR